NRFLRYQLVHRGRVASVKSWKTFGQHVYDFFSFLEANDLRWDERRGLEGESQLAAYRDYCLRICRLKPRTINQRLGTIVRFYEYAYRQNWIAFLPYEMETVGRGRDTSLLEHLTPFRKGTRSADVMLRAQRPEVKYLSRDQLRLLLASIHNDTHKLMVRMGLQVGLRREEIATFPTAYIAKARQRAGRTGMIKIRLVPTDGNGLKTKGNRERSVFFPAGLVDDLWDYIVHQRAQLLRHSESEPSQLFLTSLGTPWANDGKGFLRVLRDIGNKINVSVHPHLLRHTYATYTLAALQTKRIGIDPLVFIQRQLGHASISTTLCYAHIASELVLTAVTAYDDEVTEWSR
ncbi:tyrosine-type recombinase/integrase, partial [Lysobacter sp. A3-1-A15]